MALILDLAAAIREFVRDGDTVAMEGFTHLIPSAAGHEIIRQRRRDLTLVRMTPDLIYDQLIGMGCARKLVFSWGGNPGVGSLHRLRDAIEHGWPRPLEIEEHSHAGMATAYAAGASNLPFGVLRGYLGSDLPKYNPRIKFIACPFTGERLAAVPAIRPDVAVIHAQQADRKGNVLLWGIVGVQKEVVMAARRAIVTVEEIVDGSRRGRTPWCCPVGWSAPYAKCAAAPFRRTRSAITLATIPFISVGTRSRASARALPTGSSATCSATADFAEFRRSLAAAGGHQPHQAANG